MSEQLLLPESVHYSTLSLKKVHQGKVRDMYEVDDHHILMVASDRISAFDIVLPDPIPGKGGVLTSLSLFWFELLKDEVNNHLSNVSLKDALPADEASAMQGRALVVKKCNPLPIEAIVRGYLVGSGWKDYQQTGELCGFKLPDGLEQAQKLPRVLFTPSTKADVGDHDMNIDFQQAANLAGEEVMNQVQEISIRLYEKAANHAAERGIIIADTKFEFGLDEDGEITLIDEVLTPDSSRFWPADEYRIGISPPSFDKQFVRDYLQASGWNKTPPAPSLPDHIISKTTEKYLEAHNKLVTR